MGGAIGKDPAGVNYNESNFFLNSQTTYKREKPARPITIHQKALLCMWIFITLLYIAIKISHFWKWISVKREKGDVEENEMEIKECEDGEKKEESCDNKTAKFFSWLLETSGDQPEFAVFLRQAIIFGFIMFYIWLIDYEHVLPRVNKEYSRDLFIFVFFLLVFVAVVLTVKKTTSDKILNRDQTEEWKGWMQVQFVWYHYFDAQEVFNSIRCYIAGYVWMTGYGNFWYFYTKKDYSFFRLTKMMWRLNFLVVMVMVITKTEFVRYYVCAMHTYWFLTVYAMLAVGAKYNENRYVMAAKFAIYFICNFIIFEFPFITYKVFWPFQLILNVRGNLDYWVYRSTLDHWATWIGMLLAYNYCYYDNLLKYLERENDDCKHERLKKVFIKIILTFFCILLVFLWFWCVLLSERAWYNTYHPYTSIIPILSYIWLRNLTAYLRTRYLGLFNWLGKITLETYLSQIHIYMMMDARKILTYIPEYPFMNFAVATIIYVTLSYILFRQTVLFSSFLLPRNTKILLKNCSISFLVILICYLLAFVLAKYHIF